MEADILLESKPHGGYDAMLHIHAKTSRTIAFRKTDKGYRWIGEQEIFQGPKKYTTEDGTLFEQICFTYEIEKVSGYPLNELSISYSGEDSRLRDKRALTLNEVGPILKEWNY